MDSKMIKYSGVIANVINSRSKDSAYAILSALSEVVSGTSSTSSMFSSSVELDSSRRTELLDSWEILRYMINEEQTIHGEFQRRFIKEQDYFSQYQGSPNPSPKLQLQMISGALRFLENQYVKYMKNQVSSNPTKSNVGPVPSPRNLIRGFLHVKYNIGSNRSSSIEQEWPPELELVDGYPIWAEIYYCLRSGNTEEAQTIISSSKPEVVASLGKFPIYLSEYLKSADRRLSESKWQEMIQEYKLIVSRSSAITSTGGTIVDPYKIALYNIIARCEQNKSFPHVFSTTQDFIWFKLSMVIISATELTPYGGSSLSSTPSSMFSNFMYPLGKLQALITQYGPEHFNKSGRNPLLYFQLLLLTQQFELAIIYLSKIDLYFVDSIHFAIGTYYYGILRTPFSPSSSTSLPSVDIVALLRQYVGQFSTTNSEDALYYYSIIRANEPIRQYQIQSRTSSFSNATSSLSFNLSQQLEDSDLSTSIGARDACIKDLILESRDFDFLIGINPFLQSDQNLSKSTAKVQLFEKRLICLDRKDRRTLWKIKEGRNFKKCSK